MSRLRVKAYRSGLFAETLTVFLLRLRGHCIAAQRYKTPVGEIDFVALRGKRLAFIEVKRRKTKKDAAWTASQATPPHLRAAQYWRAGHLDFAGHDTAFDVVLAAPFARPRYIANVFPL